MCSSCLAYETRTTTINFLNNRYWIKNLHHSNHRHFVRHQQEVNHVKRTSPDGTKSYLTRCFIYVKEASQFVAYLEYVASCIISVLQCFSQTHNWGNMQRKTQKIRKKTVRQLKSLHESKGLVTGCKAYTCNNIICEEIPEWPIDDLVPDIICF